MTNFIELQIAKAAVMKAEKDKIKAEEENRRRIYVENNPPTDLASNIRQKIIEEENSEK